MIDFSQFNSLLSLMMYFNNETTCQKAIVETRWGKGKQQDVFALTVENTTAWQERTESSVAPNVSAISHTRWVLSLKIAKFRS